MSLLSGGIGRELETFVCGGEVSIYKQQLTVRSSAVDDHVVFPFDVWCCLLAWPQLLARLHAPTLVTHSVRICISVVGETIETSRDLNDNYNILLLIALYRIVTSNDICSKHSPSCVCVCARCVSMCGVCMYASVFVSVRV